MSKSPVILYVGVFADGENASPGVAKVVLDDAFLALVERLRKVVAANELYHATVFCSPEQWGADNGWNMQVEELVVGESGWYFTGSPKHSDYYVGTRMIDHDETRRLIAEVRAAGRSCALHECDEVELIEEGVLPDPEAEEADEAA